LSIGKERTDGPEVRFFGRFGLRLLVPRRLAGMTGAEGHHSIPLQAGQNSVLRLPKFPPSLQNCLNLLLAWNMTMRGCKNNMLI